MARELTKLDRQRLQALEVANRRRRMRADLREALREGDVEPLALLRGENEAWEGIIESWRLDQLVPLVQGIGAAMFQEICEVGPFSPTMLVSALSAARRRRLAELVAEGRRSGPLPRR